VKATIATRATPPLLVALACLLLWVAFDHTTGDADAWIALYVATVSALGAVFLVIATTHWRPQGLGLLAFLIGIAWYFGALGTWRAGWRGTFTTWELDAIRASISVGCTLILVGLCWWARKQMRDDVDAGPIVGPVDRVLYDGPERRTLIPGRRSADRIRR
jgi:hypothetical protein